MSFEHFSKFDAPPYIPLQVGVHLPGISEVPGATKGLVVPNEYFDKTPAELRKMGVPEWFVEKHVKLKKPENDYPDVAAWIEGVSGITQRLVASPEETLRVMGRSAVADLFQNLDKADIPTNPKNTGLVMASTSVVSVKNGEYPLFTDYPELEKIAREITADCRLAVSEVLNNACAAGVGGIEKAILMLRNNPELSGAVVLTAEKFFSDAINRADLGTAPLFGDAAVAMFVSRNSISGISLRPLGSYCRLDQTEEALGSLHISSEDVENDNLRKQKKRGKLFMNGRETFKRATKLMPEAVAILAEHLKLDLKTLKLILAHQANARILKFIEYETGIRTPIHMEAGNISSATIFHLFHQLLKNREINFSPDDLVALVGFGMGEYLRSMIAKVVYLS
ncbi:MAG: 3-oxoacyl-[acyl-carrier-protein] synthase III C-terminal domain-containing protein [Patescibacteria group bacterium]